MDVQHAIQRLRAGEELHWPQTASTLAFAESLDNDRYLVNLRDEFNIPSKVDLKRGRLIEDHIPSACDSSIYFCGNSLGLQPKAVKRYLSAYLQTWNTIAVGAHFTQLSDSPLPPFQDLAAECSRRSAPLLGASPDEVVVMNTLTVNLHLMLAAFYQPSSSKRKIMVEWRPFPSDWYAIESQIEWHGLAPRDCMLPVQPDVDGYTVTTEHICSLITQHADTLALILLPGIQYYSGQLYDIRTITRHAHKHNVLIGWDLAHAVGNIELALHDWDVDFACWCTYKYLNAGAGAMGAAFVHARHGDVLQNRGLRGWYGGDKSVRFQMDNSRFVPTPGAQGFQLSTPSAVDLSCLAASLEVFGKTDMRALRDRSLLLTAYLEVLLRGTARRMGEEDSEAAARPVSPRFEIITPMDPRQRGAQLSVLLREELLTPVSDALTTAGIVCDKRKPGIIRVAPVPLYNTFAEVWMFVEVFERALQTDRRENGVSA